MLLKRLLATTALSALLLSAETDYRFAFPQSELLLGVDLKWLIKSPLGATMRKEMQGNMGDLKPLEMLIEQIDTIHLSVVSKNAKGSDLLVLVQGRFEVDRLLDLGVKNGFRTEQWGKVKALVPVKAKATAVKKVAAPKTQFNLDMSSNKPAFAIVDGGHILMGEEAPLRVALERMETGLTPQANPLFERARDLESAHDVWLVGNTAPLNLNAGGAKTQDPMSQLASQIRSFAVGIAVRRDVAMDVQLQATSPKAAAQMLDLVKGAVAMAKMNPNPAESLPVDLDKVLQFSASGNLVRATLTIDQSEMDKIMSSRMLASALPGGALPSRGASTASVSASAATPVPVPVPVVVPVVPARKTVIIYGLPGGPKEVPVN